MKKINSLQIGILIYFLIRSMSLGISIDSYIEIGGVDGYLSPIIGFIIGFIPLFIYISILNYKPELNIIEKINYLFGKKLGYIINIFINIAVLFCMWIIFFNLLNFISSQYLYKTSILYISLIFGFCFIYTCTKNIDILLRCSNILFYISLVIIIICMLGLYNNINLDNLLPFLENGIKGPFISGLAHVSYSVIPLYLILLIPKADIRDNYKLTKLIIIFYIIANIAKFLTIFYTLSIFGIDLASIYEFPDYALLRKISTSGFFQRFESILATQWIFDLYMMLSMCFMYIKYSYRTLYKQKYENIFISIIILISCYICSEKLFSSNTIADNFIVYKYPIILGLLFLIPLFIFIKSKNKS